MCLHSVIKIYGPPIVFERINGQLEHAPTIRLKSMALIVYVFKDVLLPDDANI